LSVDRLSRQRENMAKKILIVDDRLDSVLTYLDAFGSRGYAVLRCSDPNIAQEIFGRENPEVVLLDVRMPGKNGLEVLKEMREKDKSRRACIIMLSAHGDTQTVVEALRLGADNFADKTYDAEKLVLVVEKELRTKDLETELMGLRAGRDGRLHTVDDIIGDSEAIKAVKRQIADYADADLTVFITGENGVGKNLVAEALHCQSKRRKRPFKHLLCSGLQPTLVESELFGYEEGAFTGANRRKKGAIESAEDGTVFLDEIGATTPEVQSKLLLLTETGVYSRVGSEGRSQRTDAWFITATNIDIPKALQAGQLRQDLFYRLNQAWIHVPALRQRGDDIILLAEHFIRAEAARTGSAEVPLSPKFMDLILGYPWPGNVRQLAAAVRKYVKSGGRDVRVHSPGMPGLEVEQDDGVPFTSDLKVLVGKEIEATEKKWMLEALRRFGGNRTKAAAWLNISRRSLMYKIKRYGLQGRI
jgi:DNA-binding NtrC family response regulator